MRARHLRLYVNVDHVATVRQARRELEPDPVAAAAACERAGADGITAHLREDRRHIQDDDVVRLRNTVRTYFNLELSTAPGMVEIAARVRPDQATLVPERREEVTTEGGLDLAAGGDRLRRAVETLRAAGIRVSLFVDPDLDAVRRSRDLGVEAVELHTGRYAHAAADPKTLGDLRDAAAAASESKLAVHAGHGLTVANVRAVAAIPEIEELNIGYSIVARAIFVGIENAVREIREAMDAARGERLPLPAP